MKVYNVGLCNFDGPNIARELTSLGADCKNISSKNELLEAIHEGAPDLIMFNRIFASDKTSGIETIQELKASPQYASIPMMLISNYSEAQEQAEQAGAVPGFGKEQLGSEKMRTVTRAALAD